MVIRVTNVHFYISLLIVVKTRNTARFVERTLKSCAIFYFSFARAQPGENFVSEGVDHFYFVIVSVSHQYHIFLWDKVHSQWMLQLRFRLNSIFVAVCMQIFRVDVSAHEQSRTRKRFHVN